VCCESERLLVRLVVAVDGDVVCGGGFPLCIDRDGPVGSFQRCFPHGRVSILSGSRRSHCRADGHVRVNAQ
jgi:hypothetical protein